MTEEHRRRGRPKSMAPIRDTRVSGYLTKEDAEYITRVSEALGFKSTSEMITAILERLCIGGFSAMVFIKLGWQFANTLAKKKVSAGVYFGLRPLPPLIGDRDDPNESEISRHLDEVKKELKESGSKTHGK